MINLRLLAALAMGLFFPLSGVASAEDLPKLTISSAAGEVTYDRSQLEAMGMVSVKTATPWNEGVVDFEGVRLSDLLEKADAKGDTATVTALNDYSVDIPTKDFSDYGTILAIKRNGAYMPVDDQGPFFVIYPFDSDPKLQGQPYYGRAVWQVKAISVE